MCIKLILIHTELFKVFRTSERKNSKEKCLTARTQTEKGFLVILFKKKKYLFYHNS